MKAITVEPKTPGSARYEEFPEPDLSEGSVLVEAIPVGVCGTDVDRPRANTAGRRRERSAWCWGMTLPSAACLDPGPSRSPQGGRPGGRHRAPSGSGTLPQLRGGRVGHVHQRPVHQRGIKEIHGFMSERWRSEPDYLIKVDPSLGILGVLLEPMTVITKALEQVAMAGQRAFLGAKNRAGDRRRADWPVGGAATEGRITLRFTCWIALKTGPKADLVRALGGAYHSGRVTGS